MGTSQPPPPTLPANHHVTAHIVLPTPHNPLLLTPIKQQNVARVRSQSRCPIWPSLYSLASPVVPCCLRASSTCAALYITRAITLAPSLAPSFALFRLLSVTPSLPLPRSRSLTPAPSLPLSHSHSLTPTPSLPHSIPPLFVVFSCFTFRVYLYAYMLPRKVGESQLGRPDETCNPQRLCRCAVALQACDPHPQAEARESEIETEKPNEWRPSASSIGLHSESHIYLLITFCTQQLIIFPFFPFLLSFLFFVFFFNARPDVGETTSQQNPSGVISSFRASVTRPWLAFAFSFF